MLSTFLQMGKTNNGVRAVCAKTRRREAAKERRESLGSARKERGH